MASPYSKPLQFPFASNLFGLDNGASGYLIPRPKFLFYIDFVITAPGYNLKEPDQIRLGYIVKTMERPKFQYDNQEMDQYNRKRIFHKKIKYTPVTITFYDPVDSVISKLIDDYNRYNFSDFSNFVGGDGNESYNTYWKNNSIKGNDMSLWGYQLKNPNNYMVGPSTGRGFPSSSENFFQEIRIYEFYGNYFSQYTLMNPKIDNITQDNNDSTAAGEFTEITITVNPEGIIYNYIDATIEQSLIASSVLPGIGFSTNNYPISAENLSQFLSNSIARAGGGLLTGLVNGIFGSFGSLNSSPNGGLGILGGAALQAASANFLGPAFNTSPTIQNQIFADTFSSTNNLTKNPIVKSNTLSGIQSITGLGSSAISVGINSAGGGAAQALNSISSLF